MRVVVRRLSWNVSVPSVVPSGANVSYSATTTSTCPSSGYVPYVRPLPLSRVVVLVSHGLPSLTPPTTSTVTVSPEPVVASPELSLPIAVPDSTHRVTGCCGGSSSGVKLFVSSNAQTGAPQSAASETISSSPSIVERGAPPSISQKRRAISKTETLTYSTGLRTTVVPHPTGMSIVRPIDAASSVRISARVRPANAPAR